MPKLTLKNLSFFRGDMGYIKQIHPITGQGDSQRENIDMIFNLPSLKINLINKNEQHQTALLNRIPLWQIPFSTILGC